MSTIDSNALYAVIRDVANQNLTINDAIDKIQAMTKTEQKNADKQGASEDLTPAEVAQVVKERDLAPPPVEETSKTTARKTKS